jgi:transmembrane sensor
MNGSQEPRESPMNSEKIRARAANWLSQLHDEQRRPGLDAEVRAWLDESDEHRRAFERMNDAWERAGEIRLRARPSAPTRPPRRPFVPWATAAAVILAVAATVYYWRGNVVATGVGQQQVRLLQDGTRIVLNTDTHIEVSYDAHARRVRLIHGEAWFEVAKNPARPFLVSVDGQEIRALGTSFIVRHDGIEDLSVTLVEGRVSVQPVNPQAETRPQDLEILSAGQRLLISGNRPPAVDHPELARITAWVHGRVELEDTPLAEATEEMNRYSKRRITVADPDVGRLRVGGVFHAGDSDEFVRVVTSAFGLTAERRGNDIVLFRASAQSSSSTPP